MAVNYSLNAGRRIMPSTVAQNMIEQMQRSRADPIIDYSQNNYANGSSSGGSILNPKISSPMMDINVVPKKNNVMTKWEGKRRDNETREALYDWRSNVSMNNEGKVTPNYYLNMLNENARSKVINKPMVEYMTQYENDDAPSFNMGEQYDLKLPSKAIYDINPGQDGIFSFKLKDEMESNTVSYNPLLPITSRNKPDGKHKAYPDERMTRYNGERAFMSEGDRITSAVELDRSDMINERKAFQADANNALNKRGTQAPRRYRTDHSDGGSMNLLEQDSNEFRNETNGLTEGRVKREKYSDANKRSTDLRKQPQVQNYSNDHTTPDLEKRIQKIHKTVYRNKARESFITNVINMFKYIFEPTAPKRSNIDYRDVGDEYSDDIGNDGLMDDENLDLNVFQKDSNFHKYWVLDKGVRKNFETDSGIQHSIKAPVSILTLDGEIVVRNVVMKDETGIKLLQRRTVPNNFDKSTYQIVEISFDKLGKDFVNKILQTKSRLANDIVDLDFEDHIKLSIIAEGLSDEFKYESKKPMNIYQRDLLNDQTMDKIQVLTNVYEQNERKHVSEKYDPNTRTVLERPSERIVNKYDGVNPGSRVVVNSVRGLDSTSITKRFNKMM